MDQAPPAAGNAATAPAAAGLLSALSRGLPDGRVVTVPDVLAALSHDDAEWARSTG